MDAFEVKRLATWRLIARSALVLAVVGMAFYGFEHWGGRSMSRLSAFVAEQGNLGPVVFMIVNAVATMFLVPQTLFTVTAGALFGWKMGAVWASIAMTGGAMGSFFVARYGVRDWLRAWFRHHVVFMKMQRLSQTHPLHVISLSRLIPVIPFPIASYMLGVTRVRLLPYVFLTWFCMLPETLFLASGGHLLHTGIAHGRASWEGAAVLMVAAVVLAAVARWMKKSFLESEGAD